MVFYKMDINNTDNVKLIKVNKIEEKQYQLLKNNNTFIAISRNKDNFFIYGDDNLLVLCKIFKQYLKYNANNFLIGKIFSENINTFIHFQNYYRFKFFFISLFCFFASFLFRISKRNVIVYHYHNDLYNCVKKYKGIR